MPSRRLSFLIALVTAFAVASPSRAQLRTGDLYGAVLDENGKRLPGVTLTLTGVGGPKTTLSDAQGDFRLTNLYPGIYSLLAELAGFSSVEQTGIEVKIGSKISIDLTMSSAVSETIMVTAERSLINPREHNAGALLTPQELEKLPTAHDPWALLRLAPGVTADRENIGGNESGQQATFVVGGATSFDNNFAVDGAIESDMAIGALGGSAGYYDFGAYEEIQLVTASTDVSIQNAGVTINQVTKRGTNTWKGDGRYLKTDGGLQAAPDNSGYGPDAVGNEIDSVEEYGANVGGPLLTDHLWAWAAYGVSDIRKISGVTGQLDHTELEDTNAKLNFQWNQNSGSVLYWKNDKKKFGRDAAFDRPPETTWNQTTPADRWKLEDTQVFSSNFTLSALYSHNDGAFTLHPQGGDTNVILDEDGIWRGSYFVFDQKATIEQGKLDGNAYFDTGDWNHELKFGAGYRTQENDSVSSLPGDGYAVLTCEGYGCSGNYDDDGNVIDPSLELAQWIRHNVAVTTKYESAWLQDTVTLDRWTVTAGLRYDRQTAHNNAVTDPGQPDVPGGLFPAINFGGDDASGLEWKSLVPRVGVTYALGEKRQTLLRGTYSQYAAQLGQWIPDYISVTAPYSYLYFYFTDANRNLKLDPAERGSLAYYYAYNVNLANPSQSPNRLDPKIDPYRTDEGTLSLQHAFGNNLAVSATLIYRKTSDLVDFRPLVLDGAGRERPATRGDYVQDGTETRLLPNGRSVDIPTYSLCGLDEDGFLVPGCSEALSATGGNLLTNGDRSIEYKGVTLGFERPMSNQWSLRGNVTYGDSKLKTGPAFRNFDNPTDIISLGAGFWGDSDDIYVDEGYGSHRLTLVNSRWSFNFSGIYQVAPTRPWGFDLGASISGREGYPFAPAGSRSVHALQVTRNLDDFRHPDVFLFDARIAKEFKVRDLSVTVSLDGFNLFNSQPVQQRNPEAPADAAELSSSYEVVERLSPRIFRWGIALRFR